MNAKTRRARRKHEKQVARQKAIKADKALKKQRMSSTADLMEGFGADVISLMTHGQELKMLTQERLKFIRSQRDLAPGATAGLKVDGFERVEQQLPAFQEAIGHLAKVKGKLDDLTTNEDRMFYIAENMDVLTEAQLTFEKIRGSFEAAENDFRQAMHRLQNPMQNAAKMDTPDGSSTEATTGQEPIAGTPVETASEMASAEQVAETAENPAPVENAPEAHQDVEIEVPAAEAANYIEAAGQAPVDTPSEPEPGDLPQPAPAPASETVSPSDGPRMAPIGS